MNFDKEANNLLATFKNSDTEDSFQFFRGNGHVIISAPHSVEQVRDGKCKYGEYQSGVLARLLHDSLNCPTIVKTKNCDDDANYDGDCKYKSFVSSHILNHEIKYLLDLHLMAPSRAQMIAIGTGNGSNILGRNDIAEFIKKAFEEKEWGIITLDDPFDATYDHTVSATIARECAIPCFQIEINSKLVSPDYPEYQLEDVFHALSEIIKALMERF